MRIQLKQRLANKFKMLKGGIGLYPELRLYNVDTPYRP
jgi:hypothetical protein